MSDDAIENFFGSGRGFRAMQCLCEQIYIWLFNNLSVMEGRIVSSSFRELQKSDLESISYSVEFILCALNQEECGLYF